MARRPMLLGGANNHFKAVCVMILMRFAISIFALALLGLAFSLSAAQSQPEAPFDVAPTAAIAAR